LTRRETDIDLPEDVTEEDLREIELFLSKHEVKYPSELEIDRTVDEMRLHMRLRNTGDSRAKRIIKQLRLTALEVTLMHSFYWISSIMLYSAGYFAAVLNMDVSPLLVLFVLSPLPFILGVVGLFRSRDERMLELEMSCVNNAASVMLAKICIVGCYNVCLNFAFSLAIAGQSPMGLMDITLLWLAPFTVVSGLSLIIASRLRGGTAVLLLLFVWGMAGMSLLLTPSWRLPLLSVHPLIYIPIILGGGALVAVQTQSLIRKMQQSMEGVYYREADH